MTHPRPPAPPPPPPPHDPSVIFMTAGIVPIGLSIAAALTSIYSQSNEHGRTAWIVTAVVGTTAMIAAAVASRDRRPPRKCDSGNDEPQ